jgi:toxin YoeB
VKRIEFYSDAFAEFTEWSKIDKSIFNRLVRLIEETRREPFSGIGKPEPLKGNLTGKWSKRINDEHRLIYEVRGDSIIIFSYRDHY